MKENLNHLLKYFSTLFIIICCNVLFSQSSSDVFTVVLDAGHGGKDPGNRGNGYYEKNIALSIALQVGSELEKKNDIRVIYTRKTDVFVNLFKRAEIANKAKADLFISIHCDAHNSNAYGAGTFVLGLHANQRNFEIAKKENSVIFKEENYEQKYGGFNPNNPESVISLVLMQEEYLDQSIKAANLIQEFFTKNLKRKNFKRGDLIFWKGHVAISLNSTKLIHAYGPKKKVLIMPTNLTIQHIKDTAKLIVKKVSNINTY